MRDEDRGLICFGLFFELGTCGGGGGGEDSERLPEPVLVVVTFLARFFLSKS